ncbi:uncharacterized protein LOC122264288 isoform X2 [Penaeus japonicus]|uniref:uncharacterized protein LOC122264288 isoform X2 n=1 Tax=Penaeus japonicus TaxID=27405 RepID=UPI001C70DDAB|nr:uncharacterized protein LOC122264288 isoform X2 [Penaeus japonicus]
MLHLAASVLDIQHRLHPNEEDESSILTESREVDKQISIEQPNTTVQTQAEELVEGDVDSKLEYPTEEKAPDEEPPRPSSGKTPVQCETMDVSSVTNSLSVDVRVKEETEEGGRHQEELLRSLSPQSLTSTVASSSSSDSPTETREEMVFEENEKCAQSGSYLKASTHHDSIMTDSGISEHDVTESDSSSESLGHEEEVTAESQESSPTPELYQTQTEAPTNGEGINTTPAETPDIDRLDRSWFDASSNDFFIASDLTENSDFVAEFEPHKEIFDELNSQKDEASKIRVKQRTTSRSHKARRAAKGDLTYDPAASDTYAPCKVDDCKKRKVKSRGNNDFDDLLFASDGEMIGGETFYMEVLSPLAEVENDMSIFDYDFEMRDDSWGTEANEPYFDVRTGQRILSTIYEFEVTSDEDDDDDDVPFALSNFRVEDHLQNGKTSNSSETGKGEASEIDVLRVNSDTAKCNGRDENILEDKAIETSDDVPLFVHENREVEKSLLSADGETCAITKINSVTDTPSEIIDQISCAGKDEAHLTERQLCNHQTDDHEAEKAVSATPTCDTPGESERNSSTHTGLGHVIVSASNSEMIDAEVHDTDSLSSSKKHTKPEMSSHAEDTDSRNTNLANTDEFVSGSRECVRKLSNFGPNPLLVLSTPSDDEDDGCQNCFGPNPVLILSPGSDPASDADVMTQESHDQPAGEYSAGRDVNSSIERPKDAAWASSLPPQGGEGCPGDEISGGGDTANASSIRNLEESLVCREDPEKGLEEESAPDTTPVQEGYADHSSRMNECADTTQVTQNPKGIRNRPNDSARCKDSEDIIAAWDSHILQHLEKDGRRDVDFDIFKVESDVFETSENITTALDDSASHTNSSSIVKMPVHDSDSIESKSAPGGVQNKAENNDNSTAREGECAVGTGVVHMGDQSEFSSVSENRDERKSVPALENARDTIDELMKASNSKDEVDTSSREKLMAENSTLGSVGEVNQTKEEESDPEKEGDKEGGETNKQEEEVGEKEEDEGVQSKEKQDKQEEVDEKKSEEKQEVEENKTIQEEEEKHKEEDNEDKIKVEDKKEREDDAEDKQERQKEIIEEKENGEKQDENDKENVGDGDRPNKDDKNTETEVRKLMEHEEGKQDQEKQERREEASEHVPQNTEGEKEATEQDVKKVENDASNRPATSPGSEESSPTEMNHQPPPTCEQNADRNKQDQNAKVDLEAQHENFHALMGNLANADFEALLRAKYSDYDPNKPPPKPKRLFLRRLSSDPNMADKISQQIENDKILAALQNNGAPKPPVRVKRRKRSLVQAALPPPSQDRPVPPEATLPNENDAPETRENGDCGSSSSSVVGYEEARGVGGEASTPSTLGDTLGILSVAVPEPREGSNDRPEGNAKCLGNERVSESCEAGTRTMHGEYLEGGKQEEEEAEGKQETKREREEERVQEESTIEKGNVEEIQHTKGKEGDVELEEIVICQEEQLEGDINNVVEDLMDIISNLEGDETPTPCVIDEDNRDKASSVSTELAQNSTDAPDNACATSAMNLRNPETPELCVQTSGKEGRVEKHLTQVEDEIATHGNEKNTEGEVGIENEGDKEGGNDVNEKKEEEKQGAGHEAIQCDVTPQKVLNKGRDEDSLDPPRPPVRKKRSPSIKSTPEGAVSPPPTPQVNQEATPPPVPLRTYRGYSSLPRPAKSQSRSSPTPHDARAPPRTKRVARSASTATCSNRPQVTPKPTASGSPQMTPASVERGSHDEESVKRVHITSLVTPRLRRIKTFLVSPVSPNSVPRRTFQVTPFIAQNTSSTQDDPDKHQIGASLNPQDTNQVIPAKCEDTNQVNTAEVTPEESPEITSQDTDHDMNYGTHGQSQRAHRDSVLLLEKLTQRSATGGSIQRKNTPHVRQRYHTIADGTSSQKRKRENSIKRRGSLRAIKYLTLPNTVFKKLKSNSKKPAVPPILCLPKIFRRKQRSYDMRGSEFSRAEIPELTPENDPDAAEGAPNASRSIEGSEEGFSSIFNFFTALEFADDKDSRPPIFTDVELRGITKDGQKRSSYPSCDTPEVPKRKRKKSLDSPIFDTKANSHEEKAETITCSLQTPGLKDTTPDDDKTNGDENRDEQPSSGEETAFHTTTDLPHDESSENPFDDSGIGLGESEEDDTPKGISTPTLFEPPAVQIQTWAERQGEKGLELPCLYLRGLPEVEGAKAALKEDEEEKESESEEEDTPSPGPPVEPEKEDHHHHHQDAPGEKKREEDRVQKDRCIEVYPETVRQRQRNMMASTNKVDIKNWNSGVGSETSQNSPSKVKKFLPSVKALRNQFETGKASNGKASETATNGHHQTSNGTNGSSSNSSTLNRKTSSSTSSLASSTLEKTSSTTSLNSAGGSCENLLSPVSAMAENGRSQPIIDPDEPVEPIFNQFKKVDEELRELMSKPPSTTGWNPRPLLKRLYYIPDAPKVQSQGTTYVNIEGYLEKLPSGRKKATFWNAWKRRYFVAKEGVLYYYQNPQADKPSMKMTLMGGKVECMEPNMVGVDDGKGHYVVVRCSSRQEAERWRRALETHTVEDFASQYVQPWPVPNDPALLRDTLVIDLGSCSVRAGVLASQATLPQLFLPSVVATERETRRQIWGFDGLAPDVRAASSISFPVRPSHKITKYSVDLSAVSSLLQKTFADLRVDPKNYHLQLSVPRVLNTNTQTELLRILFDKFGVKSVNLTHQSILALYAYNATSGIVVDIGERMDIVPVIDGYIVDGGVSRVPYGGYRILDHLRQFLYMRNVSLINEVESYIIRHVLENICYCAHHYNTEKARCSNNPDNFEKGVSLSEFFHGKDCPYENISLDFGRFQATEGLFNPDAWGLDHPGLHKLVYKAIMECSMDIRKEMSRSIFLAGGVTQVPGLVDRLTTEIDNLTPPAIRPKVHASPYRYHAAYIGACVLAESPGFVQSRVTREEWNKQGAAALRKWSM